MYNYIALNVFTLLIFIGIFVGVNNLKEFNKVTQRKIIRNVSILLLTINIVKIFVVDYFIPVEFSTVSYYVVPAILLFRVKKLEIWAAYAGLMAGFFYYLTMMIQGGIIYESYHPLTIHASLFCHGALLFLSLFKLKNESYNKNKRYILLLGLFIMIFWALIMRQYLQTDERIFIYELLDGVYVTTFTDSSILLLIYYVSIISLVVKSTSLIFSLNTHLYRKQDQETQYTKDKILKRLLNESFGKTMNLK